MGGLSMLDKQEMIEFYQTQTMPCWSDRRALQQIWDFCCTFPEGTRQRSIAAWTQSYIRSGRMPPPNLRARLIQTALQAGWRVGIRNMWELEEIPESWEG
jgi:hypothetical protein